jgi:hypothetical protein
MPSPATDEVNDLERVARGKEDSWERVPIPEDRAIVLDYHQAWVEIERCEEIGQAPAFGYLATPAIDR